MQPGTRVCTKFTHDGQPVWFLGEIMKQGSSQVKDPDGLLRWVPAASGWMVKFDDGEECAVPPHSLKHEGDMQVVPVDRQLDTELVASADSLLEADAALAQGVEQQQPDAAGAPSSGALPAEAELSGEAELPQWQWPGAHVKVEHEEHSCRVKDEHEQQAASGVARRKDQATLKREAHRHTLQVEPDGKTPRAVFRAGCAKRCLTKVLGGVGTKDERFVREDKVMPDGHVLIRKGEMYLWGRADWNTYAPSFAGDIGTYRDDLGAKLLKQQARMGWAAPQESFHLFRQCTSRFLIDFPLSAYHGKAAEKKTLYCGKYRVDDVTYEQSFKQLPECTKQCICDDKAKKELSGADKSVLARRASEILSQREEEDKVYTMCSVEFVEYDEKLYQALVKSDASNGRVEVDDPKLGPL